MASETEAGTRYLEVTVTRTQSSVVYLAVPEDHPGLAKPGLSGLRQYLRAAAEKTVREGEWETEDGAGSDWLDMREVSEREARQYAVYEVPGPTAAERRAELEKAGQKGLDLL